MLRPRQHFTLPPPFPGMRMIARRRVIHCAFDHRMKCKNILEAIGPTPLIRLNRLARDCKAEVYVKAAYLNPGGSVKDRIGITMIGDAGGKGLITPGGRIIDGTSGTTAM